MFGKTPAKKESVNAASALVLKRTKLCNVTRAYASSPAVTLPDLCFGLALATLRVAKVGGGKYSDDLNNFKLEIACFCETSPI